MINMINISKHVIAQNDLFLLWKQEDIRKISGRYHEFIVLISLLSLQNEIYNCVIIFKIYNCDLKYFYLFTVKFLLCRIYD